MKPFPTSKLGFTLAGMLALIVPSARADPSGTTGNEFTIDFVDIGNADDAAFDDTAPDFSSPYGGISYTYRMATYEISQDAITKATTGLPGGLASASAGAWSGGRPAANMTWYEAAASVMIQRNWPQHLRFWLQAKFLSDQSL